MHLSRDEFLDRLAALLAQRKDAGSVFLTQKRLTYDAAASTGPAGDDVEMTDAPSSSRAHDLADGDAEREWPLLVRATDGKGKKDTKVKISTTVDPADIEAFLSAYSTLLRSTFSAALRPKRKKGDLARQRAAKLAQRQAAKKGAATAGEAGTGTEVGAAKKGPATTTVMAGQQGAGFVPRLPKVVGPRRGNGVQKRRRLVKRREKAVARTKASRARATAE
ncbi:hypothetical protein JCM8202_000720 [Rhodotorula sphaerocarpa]